jgi:hypothetical protein
MKKLLTLLLIVSIFASSSSAHNLSAREQFLVSFGVAVCAMLVYVTGIALEQAVRRDNARRKTHALRYQPLYQQLRRARNFGVTMALNRFHEIERQPVRQPQADFQLDDNPPATHLFDDLRATVNEMHPGLIQAETVLAPNVTALAPNNI